MGLGQAIGEANWRTGSVVHADSHQILATLLADVGRSDLASMCSEPGAAAVIVSQWCDLVHDSLDDEPTVEVLVALPHETEDANDVQPYLKSFRVLDMGVAGTTLRFLARCRGPIRRERLLELKRDEARELSFDDAMRVQRWLGWRYSRFPLPGELEVRLNLRNDPARKILSQLSKVAEELRIKVTPEDQELAGGAYDVQLYVITKLSTSDRRVTEPYDKLKDWAKGVTGVVIRTHLRNADAFSIREAYETRHLTAEMFTFGKKGQKGPHPTDGGDGVV